MSRDIKEMDREDREMQEQRVTIALMKRCIYGVNLQSEPDVLMQERRGGYTAKLKGEY